MRNVFLPHHFEGWKAIAETKMDEVDDDYLSTVYSKSEQFAYTIITLHHIIAKRTEGDFDENDKDAVEFILQ